MQKYQVLISELAERELGEIFYYIGETVSDYNANKVVNKIWQSIFSLEFLPKRGTRFKPIPDVWAISVKKYKYYLIYEINDNKHTVVVHHVIHQRRNLSQLLLK